MFKFKIQNKITTTICLMILSLSCFSYITPQSAKAEERYKPTGSRFEKRVARDLYAYQLGLFGLYGLYDERKRYIVYPPQFNSIMEIFANAYVVVERNGLLGAINGNGVMIHPLEWTDVQYLTRKKDTLKVEKDGYYGWVNQYGEYIKTPQYVYLGALTDDLACACTNQNACGIISKRGNEVLPMVYNGIIGAPGYEYYYGSKYYFSFLQNGKYGVIDLNGNIIVEPKLPPIYLITSGLIVTKGNYTYKGDSVHVNDNYPYKGLVNMYSGKTLLEPFYETVSALDQVGYFKMKLDGKWGVVDLDGNIIYPCKYSSKEITKMMNEYPVNTKYQSVLLNHYYNEKLLEAEYYLIVDLWGKPVQKIIDELLQVDSEDVKTKTQNLMKKYGISRWENGSYSKVQ